MREGDRWEWERELQRCLFVSMARWGAVKAPAAAVVADAVALCLAAVSLVPAVLVPAASAAVCGSTCVFCVADAAHCLLKATAALSLLCLAAAVTVAAVFAAEVLNMSHSLPQQLRHSPLHVGFLCLWQCLIGTAQVQALASTGCLQAATPHAHMPHSRTTQTQCMPPLWILLLLSCLALLLSLLLLHCRRL